ncbi:[NiFe]-hydrogenase assembly chaperone HybE [Notoacmeibacter sp. MSK16QG-6]|uniref:[NiFe]-hydrogenase assembly chaperone HybE n=1 Tax=Notoacmeibacter sp. MSK16QG-6 TaxID=2957982 RepID=UPI00209E5DA6|nr:[NiFe]-hydrogenase assembly chaperone HybE [Notoacmeibacter sp. MSK16QG-6]MCP1198366.1 [NiFe]-hydrogenase assembly chaperone HybE [Notoacmeibacter sp. MSK16QG-6]
MSFEGSYLGANDKISVQAIMECKICWTPYDPKEGDETRQVMPGTPFIALPADWKCPNCDAPKEQFLVSEDPGSDHAREEEMIATKTRQLEADFMEVWHGQMRDVPLVNKALRVEAVAFRMHEGRPLGILITPWFMNLVQLPADGEDWSDLNPRAKEYLSFASGEYEFIHNVRPMVGGYKACSLFSPMGDFNTQAQATAVAEAAMIALFQDEHRGVTDHAADIREAREQELAALENDDTEADAQAPQVVQAKPSRRQVITGGLSQTAVGREEA